MPSFLTEMVTVCCDAPPMRLRTVPGPRLNQEPEYRCTNCGRTSVIRSRPPVRLGAASERAMRNALDACRVQDCSSRTCERGTNGCTVVHAAPTSRASKEPE